MKVVLWACYGIAVLIGMCALLSLPFILIGLTLGWEVAPGGVLVWALIGFGSFMGLEMRDW